MSDVLFEVKRWKNQFFGKYPRCKINCSKNTTKKYYIIRRIGDSGFFSNYLYVLGHIAYAEKKGYMPVIDMMNYPSVYNENECVNGTLNSWEYYFYQPNGEELQDAYNAPNTILSDSFYLSKYTVQYVGKKSCFPNKEKIHCLADICKRNIILKGEIQHHIEQKWQELLGDCSGKVLGLHIRGTDMKCCKDHPKPPSIEEFFKKIEILEKQYHFEKILVCTDEEQIIERMRDVYGKKVVYTGSYRAKEESTQGVHLSKENPRSMHRYWLGLEVLTDAVLLARCNVLLCGNSNVTLAATILNDNEYEEVIHIN